MPHFTLTHPVTHDLRSLCHCNHKKKKSPNQVTYLHVKGGLGLLSISDNQRAAKLWFQGIFSPYSTGHKGRAFSQAAVALGWLRRREAVSVEPSQTSFVPFCLFKWPFFLFPPECSGMDRWLIGGLGGLGWVGGGLNGWLNGGPWKGFDLHPLEVNHSC